MTQPFVTGRNRAFQHHSTQRPLRCDMTGRKAAERMAVHDDLCACDRGVGNDLVEHIERTGFECSDGRWLPATESVAAALATPAGMLDLSA